MAVIQDAAPSGSGVRDMKLRILTLLATVATFTVPTYGYKADAGIPVTCLNCASIAQQIKDSAIQVKDLAIQAKQGLDLANTYFIAAQNTVDIPLSVLRRAEGLYNRSVGIYYQTSQIVGPNGSMMQRVRATQALGRNAAGMPGDAIYSFEYWNQQRERQMEENERLLGLQDEQQQIIDEMAKDAEQQAVGSLSDREMMKAQSLQMGATTQQLRAINMQMSQAYQYQIQKDQEAAIQREAYQKSRDADYVSARAQAAAPAFMEQSPITWGN